MLDVDAELGEDLTDEQRMLARRVCRARLLQVPAGRWPFAPQRDRLGFLLIDGIVCREVSIVDRHSLELLGTGDVVTPVPASEWPQLGPDRWITAVTDVIAVALDARFIRAAARWPELMVSLQRRIEAQRMRLQVQGLITHLPRAEHRLLLVLWHLAGRLGRVTTAGIVIPLYLTHDLLGQLIAARRSTVTLAVGRAEQDGWLVRRDDGLWLLPPRAEQLVDSLTGVRAPRSNGETLMLHQRSHELARAAQAVRASVRQRVRD